MSTVAHSEFDAAIREAQRKLDAFERSASGRELVVRLRAYSPLHPFLMMRGLAMLLTVGALVLSLVALGLPFISPEVAEVVGALDKASGVPLPGVLAVLVVCFFAFGLGAHSAAKVAARSAPLLPGEAKIHQRLVSDLQQLEAQRNVQKRMTPMGAEPRKYAR